MRLLYQAKMSVFAYYHQNSLRPLLVVDSLKRLVKEKNNFRTYCVHEKC